MSNTDSLMQMFCIHLCAYLETHSILCSFSVKSLRRNSPWTGSFVTGTMIYVPGGTFNRQVTSLIRKAFSKLLTGSCSNIKPQSRGFGEEFGSGSWKQKYE